MNRILIIIIALLWAMPSICSDVVPEDDRVRVLVESLKTQPQNTARLDTLLKLIKITQPNPNERVIYVNQLIEDAKVQNNKEYEAKGYLYHMFMAYNQLDVEAINAWMYRVEPLARSEKLYDILFQAKQCVIDMLIITEEYEREEAEAKEMIREAKLLNNDMGQLVGYQCLANGYLFTYRPYLAIDQLEKAVEIASRMDNFSLYYELINGLIQTYMVVDDRVNLLRYLQLQENNILSYIDKCPDYRESTVDDLMVTYAQLLGYYCQEGDIDNMKKYKSLSNKYYSDEYSYITRSIYYNSMYLYSYAVSDYDNALIFVDSLLNGSLHRSDLEYNSNMTMRASVLMKMGRSQEAVKLFTASSKFKDSVQTITIEKQLEHIKKRYNASQLILENQKIKQYRHRCLILAISLVLMVLTWFIMHTIKVQSGLKKAEHDMRQMSQEMEHANRVKDNFLNNISQSISTPLNTIVDESMRLSFDKQTDKSTRIELTNSIRRTSNELMTTINNILDLSRLESGMMKFMLSQLNVIELVEDAVREASQYNHVEDISVDILTSKDTNYFTTIDAARLMTTFRSLLAKASADTELSITVEESAYSQVLHVDIFGSALAVPNPSQDVIIRNEINRMFINNFKGKYVVNTPQCHVQMTIVIEKKSETPRLFI